MYAARRHFERKDIKNEDELHRRFTLSPTPSGLNIASVGHEIEQQQLATELSKDDFARLLQRTIARRFLVRTAKSVRFQPMLPLVHETFSRSTKEIKLREISKFPSVSWVTAAECPLPV